MTLRTVGVFCAAELEDDSFNPAWGSRSYLELSGGGIVDPVVRFRPREGLAMTRNPRFQQSLRADWLGLAAACR